MDGVSEDFSGLPPRREREREFSPANRSGARRYRAVILASLIAGFSLFGLGLIVFFAPAPYLSMSHSALAESVDASPSTGCFPAGQGWTCVRTAYGTDYRYRVTADWAGCWTGRLVPEPGVVNEVKRKISGCATAFDHLKAR